MGRTSRVVVAGAAFRDGADPVADAVADALRRAPAPPRVASIDLMAKCAPRASRLAALAYRGGTPFLPGGRGRLADLLASEPEDALLRELATGGSETARATLVALEPDLIVASTPAVGAIAAEVTGGRVPVLVVVDDHAPAHVWLHPDARLHLVAGDVARDWLARSGVAWGAIAVTGVPCEDAPTRASARAGLDASGLEDRATALVVSDAAAPVVAALAGAGVQVLVPHGAGVPRRRGVVIAPEGMAVAPLVAAADLVVCDRCAALLWLGPAAGVPLVVLGPVTPLERGSVDILVTLGAALEARDLDVAAVMVELLLRAPERLAAMGRAASALGRPAAARAVAGHVLALLD